MRGVICPKCRTIREIGTKCKTCQLRYNKDYNSKRSKDSKSFYNSKEWFVLRTKVKNYYCCVDIWILGLEGKIVPCQNPIVHHIRERSKYPNLALDFENLICVSSTSHNTIHEWYNTGRFEKALAIINEGKRIYEDIRAGMFYDSYGMKVQ